MARSSGVGGKTSMARTFSSTEAKAAGEVEFKDAPGPGDVVLAGDLLAVQPDVGAVVHAIEVERNGASGETGGQAELSAIPPAAFVRTVIEHGEVGELAAERVVHAGEFAQVHPVERVFDDVRRRLGRRRRWWARWLESSRWGGRAARKVFRHRGSGYALSFRPAGPVEEPCSTQADCNCHPEWRSRRVAGASGGKSRRTERKTSRRTASRRRLLRATECGRDIEVPRREWYMRSLRSGVLVRLWWCGTVVSLRCGMAGV